MTSHAPAVLRHLTAQLGVLERVEYSETPWQSATFDGARHCFVFMVHPAVDLATFAHDLPEADISVPGGFVAEAIVTGIDGTRVSMEVLTIDAT